ncbi:MAG: peptidoglycan D,D-transpeptidase FtsI family protein [Roseburia sp.]
MGEKKEEKKEKKEKTHKNREFAVITYSFLGIFVCVMLYFSYFEFVKSEDFINNPYNTRQSLFERSVARGTIYSADGKVLADTVADRSGSETRRYPYGEVFAHVVGYSTNGRMGIEAQENFHLLRSNTFFLEKAVDKLKGEKSPGDDVITTLDSNLQITAYDALGTYDGAIIVMEPSTGKILAMVSKPDFDPNNISEDWEQLTADDNDSTVLLNRATQGLYPPGSTFKILTTLQYIHENPDFRDFQYDCTGIFTMDGQSIRCYNSKKHGTIDLKTAMAKSCNAAYASIGVSLNLSDFADFCNTILFNSPLPTKFESSMSSFVLEEGDDIGTVMGTAIGQGKTLVTPMHMALLTCAIANDGILMSPYVVDSVVNENGQTIRQYDPAEYGALFSAEDAAILQEYMGYVVEEGTANALFGQSYQAIGKTGSAEFSSSSNSSHSWFIGYAGREDKSDIAVAVVVENSGLGSQYAVPIAKRIFDAYYNE